jgi:hypothetical protein
MVADVHGMTVLSSYDDSRREAMSQIKLFVLQTKAIPAGR